jgi:hypothetical protein
MSFISKLCEEKGLTLKEGTDHLEIELTAGDIKAARRKDAQNCAFAQSVKRTERAVAAYVFRTKFYIEYKDKTIVRYILPPSMQKEVVSFDRSGEMDPGHYRLSPIPKSLTLDRQRAAGKKWRKENPQPSMPPSGKKKKVPHHTKNIRAGANQYQQ